MYFKEFFLNLFHQKNNLEYAKNKFAHKFDINFFPALLLKDLVISHESYQKLSSDKDLKTNIFLQKQIYINLLKTLNEINTLLQVVNLKKRQLDPFSYSIKINTSNYHYGYLTFNINPLDEFTDEQKLLLQKNIIKEIFLISPLLSSTRSFLSESNKNKNIYSHMNEAEAIEYMHNKISEELKEISHANKKNIFIHK